MYERRLRLRRMFVRLALVWRRRVRPRSALPAKTLRSLRTISPRISTVRGDGSPTRGITQDNDSLAIARSTRPTFRNCDLALSIKPDLQLDWRPFRSSQTV